MTQDHTLISPGTLYVVATPIGNLGDLSPRAVSVLKGVGLILAEDTRSFRVLAQMAHIETPCISYHDHNERSRTASVIEELRKMKAVALVSEAGTPAISDPGYRVVRACREEGIPVVSVPGPSALVAALSISGFEINSFLFLGFLPQRPGRKRKSLQNALSLEKTFVIFESPHRIQKTLTVIEELDRGREVAVCRELTKKFEETLWGNISEVRSELAKRPEVKGEIVLIVRGLSEIETDPENDGDSDET